MPFPDFGLVLILLSSVDQAGVPFRCAMTRRRSFFLPTTSAATPVSAAPKQQNQNNNDKDQFHRKPPTNGNNVGGVTAHREQGSDCRTVGFRVSRETDLSSGPTHVR